MPLIDLTRQTNLIVDSGQTLTVSGTLDLNGSAMTGDGSTVNVGASGDAQNLKIWGNLDIQGTTTTVDTATLQIEDPIMQLNYMDGTAQAGANGGIHIGRSGATDASLIFDEADDTWKMGLAGAETAIGGITNLSLGTVDGSGFALNSSTGDNVALTAASTTVWGLMTDDDKTKLDGIETSADVNVPTNLSLGTVDGDGFALNSSTGDNVALTAASTSVWGLMTDELFDDLAKVKAYVTKMTNVPGAFTTTNTATITGKTLDTLFTSTIKDTCLLFINGQAIEKDAITSIAQSGDDILVTVNITNLNFSLEAGDEIMLCAPMSDS